MRMITEFEEALALYFQAVRELTQTEVDARAAKRAANDVTARDREEAAVHHAEYEVPRH